LTANSKVFLIVQKSQTNQKIWQVVNQTQVQFRHMKNRGRFIHIRGVMNLIMTISVITAMLSLATSSLNTHYTKTPLIKWLTIRVKSNT